MRTFGLKLELGEDIRCIKNSLSKNVGYLRFASKAFSFVLKNGEGALSRSTNI